MKIVIQCAAKKASNAGVMIDQNGARVLFVAAPDGAPPGNEFTYAKPDDIARTGESWRDILLQYNSQTGYNPLGLCPAIHLYMNPTYRALAERYAVDNIFILSAGWGLLTADFLTPKYDITFSPSADTYKRRKKLDVYRDFRMLPEDCDDDLVFFGGKDYLPLFSDLSSDYSGRKFVFYSSKVRPDAPGCELLKYHTKTRTNWHYECAKALIDGVISLSVK